MSIRLPSPGTVGFQCLQNFPITVLSVSGVKKNLPIPAKPVSNVYKAYTPCQVSFNVFIKLSNPCTAQSVSNVNKTSQSLHSFQGSNPALACSYPFQMSTVSVRVHTSMI
jgi:hypothetical protein